MRVKLFLVAILVSLTFQACKSRSTGGPTDPTNPPMDVPKSDWTFELAAADDGTDGPIYATGLVVPQNILTRHPPKPTGAKLAAPILPASFDWRPFGLSPIRDQGECGSCWAFTGTSMAQDAIMLFRQNISLLAPQYPLSCNVQGSSCKAGGFMGDALDLFQENGVVLEADYPYTGSSSVCKKDIKFNEKIVGWNWVDSDAVINNFSMDSVDAIKAAVIENGPVATGIQATRLFMNYKSGIFNGCATLKKGKADHAVNIVGWNDTGKYWIIRNSWGKDWGELGYGRIKWNCNNIGTASVFAIVDKLHEAALPVTSVDTVPPVCKITAPSSGTTIAKGQVAVNITVSASDNVGVKSTTVLLDGVSVGSPVFGIYRVKTANIKAGNHKLVCEVKDAQGNVGRSSEVLIKK